MSIFNDTDYLTHHGIDGQVHGIRNGPPYPLGINDLSPEERKALAKENRELLKRKAALEKQDMKWATKNEKTLYKKAYKESEDDLRSYVNQLNQKYKLNANGKVSAAYINDFNRKMAQLMTEKVSNLKAPSGRVVTFVHKRGEVGVFMALADQGYDMNRVKNGVWDSGRIAYRKTQLEKIES